MSLRRLQPVLFESRDLVTTLPEAHADGAQLLGEGAQPPPHPGRLRGLDGHRDAMAPWPSTTCRPRRETASCEEVALTGHWVQWVSLASAPI